MSWSRVNMPPLIEEYNLKLKCLNLNVMFYDRLLIIKYLCIYCIIVIVQEKNFRNYHIKTIECLSSCQTKKYFEILFLMFTFNVGFNDQY